MLFNIRQLYIHILLFYPRWLIYMDVLCQQLRNKNYELNRVFKEKNSLYIFISCHFIMSSICGFQVNVQFILLKTLYHRVISIPICYYNYSYRKDINTLRQRQNGRHFADDIFRCIFFSESGCISMNISLKFVPKGQINNIPALVQIVAWCRPGDKPLSEPMIVRSPTHICVTRPQWVNQKRAVKCIIELQDNI